MAACRLSAINRTPPANRLLAALPTAEFLRLAPSLDVVPLALRHVLYNAGDPIAEVYFPGGGSVSIVTVLNNGDMVEAATIGREGMVGLAALHENGASPSGAIVQARTNTCYRMSAVAFRNEMNRREGFHDVISRFAQAFVGFVMQSTACNAVHSVEQRLARWLLAAHDRVGRDDFPLTQEFVATMLGVSRPTVSVVAATLQKAGVIAYHRGHLTVINREKLEFASCECYRVTAELLKDVIRRSAA